MASGLEIVYVELINIPVNLELNWTLHLLFS